MIASQAIAADKTLFDGKTLKGWENHGADSWRVRDGALVCDGSAPSWIGTSESFSDYNLTLEFRGPGNVNSGVFLRSQKEGQPHVTGYELQIWDYQPAGFNTGSLVNTAKASETKIIPDKWNKYEIISERRSLCHHPERQDHSGCPRQQAFVRRNRLSMPEGQCDRVPQYPHQDERIEKMKPTCRWQAAGNVPDRAGRRDDGHQLIEPIDRY